MFAFVIVSVAESNMFRLGRTLLSEALVTSQILGKVGLLTINRPKALNALNKGIFEELSARMVELDKTPEVGAIIITGEGKAFAAGVDIKMMKSMGFSEVLQADLGSDMDAMKTVRTPIIAAVNGFAFGGGCELAMMCDIIIASDKAVFGQPEIKVCASVPMYDVWVKYDKPSAVPLLPLLHIFTGILIRRWPFRSPRPNCFWPRYALVCPGAGPLSMLLFYVTFLHTPYGWKPSTIGRCSPTGPPAAACFPLVEGYGVPKDGAASLQVEP